MKKKNLIYKRNEGLDENNGQWGVIVGGLKNSPLFSC